MKKHIQDYLIMLRALSRNERLLVHSQAISTVGDFMALPAFLNLASYRGDHLVSLFLIVYFLPRTVQPLLGIIVDRFNPKMIVLISEIMRAMIFMVLYWYPRDYPVSGWLLLPMFSSVFGCLFEPARLKIMSQISRDFTHLNSIFYFFYSVTGVFSLGLSIILEKYVNTETIFLVNAITFLVSYGMLILVTYRVDSKLDKEKLCWSDLVKGFVLVGRSQPILLCTGLVVVIDFFTGVLYELFPEKSMEIGFGQYGTYIYSCLICIGNAVGSLFITRADQRRYILSYSSLIACSCLCAFVLNQQSFISLMSCFIFFTIQIYVIGTSEIIIEATIPKQFHGRLFAINESLPIIALSFGSLVAGMAGNYTLCLLAAVAFLGYFVITYPYFAGTEKASNGDDRATILYQVYPDSAGESVSASQKT